MTRTADPIEVMRELREPLSGFISRRVADPQDAEDVLQEVMLRLHRHGDDLARADSVGAWVHRVARNAITDHYRRRSARPESPGGAAIDVGGGIGAPAGEPGSPELRRELAKCLRPLIDQLPAKYREALILTEYEGLTQAEAALRMGTSISGAKTRVQRARAQLKDLLLSCCHVEFDRRGGITDYHANRACKRCNPPA
jgi:RNA polymerase sigma-70 factor (ECF subfamily)